MFLRVDYLSFASRMFDACIQAGFAPRIAQQVVEVPATLNLVAAGLGVALVPASLALLRIDAVCISSLSLPHSQLNGDVYVLWRTEDVTQAMAEFRQQLLGWAHVLMAPKEG